MCVPVRIKVHDECLQNLESWIEKKDKNYYILHTKQSYIKIYKHFTFPKLKTQVSTKYITIKLEASPETQFEVHITPDRLQISPNPRNDLPLYYYLKNKTIYIASDFCELIKCIPRKQLPQLNINGIHKYLLKIYEDNQTLLQNVFLLRENEVLEYSREEIVLKENPIYFEHDEVVPESINEVLEKFNARLDYIFFTYFKKIKNKKTALTLSGGDDSSIVAYFMKHCLQTKIYSYCINMNENSQIKRYINVASWLNVNKEVIESNKFDMKWLFTKDLHNPYDDTYAQLNDLIAKSARRNGISVLFSGGGGDDIFPINTIIKRIITPKYLNVKTQHAKLFKPLPKVPLSARHGNIAYNSTFLKRGIWVINPLLYKETISFVLALPKKYQNRFLVFKNFQHKKKYPISQLQYIQKDSFHGILKTAMERFIKSGIKDLLESSVLADISILDKKMLQDEIKKSNMLLPIGSPLYKSLYRIISLEAFLQNYTKRMEV